MASGLSHIMLTQKILDGLSPGKLKNYLAYNSGLVFVGSVAPDLPYLSILDSSFTENDEFLANYFHYDLTDQIVKEGLRKIKASTDSEEVKAAQFTLIAGYASHVIVDGIFHPFVRDKVGDYNAKSKNKTNHRLLEMKIDVLLMQKLYGHELNTSAFQDILTTYQTDEHSDEAFKLFLYLIKDVYGRLPEYIEKQSQITFDKLIKWISALHRSLNMAEGDFPKLYREVVGKKALAYLNLEDILTERDELLTLGLPVDRKVHNLSDNFLQQGREIKFFDDVYPRCLKKVPEFWESACEYVFGDGGEPDFPAINLDNGRLSQNSRLTEIPYYWRG